MLSTRVALRPRNEAPRKTWPGLRGTTNYITNSNNVDSTSLIRLQRLSAVCGIVGARAELISSLIWGEAV